MLLTSLMLTPKPADAGTLPRYQNLHTAVRAAGSLIPQVQQASRTEQDEMLCLALNIYHEIRGGTPRDQWAVGYVTMNRTKHRVFKSSSICGIVWAKGQFSWTRWATRAQLPTSQAAWTECQRKAVLLINGEKMNDPTNGSTHFNGSLRNWGRGLVNKFRIGPHWFARLPGIN